MATTAAKGNLDGLWRILADDAVLREKVLKDGSLFAWPSSKLTGIINFHTMVQNTAVLIHLLKLWCPQVPGPKTISPDHARKQAQVCWVCVQSSSIYGYTHVYQTTPLAQSWPCARSPSSDRISACPWTASASMLMPFAFEPSAHTWSGGMMVR